MMTKPYSSIVRFAEQCLDRHGDNFLGVGWTKNREQADRRYGIMLGLLAPAAGRAVTLLDFGCGASHLYEYIRAQGRDDIRYSGLDVSPQFLHLSRSKFPDVTYYDVDVLEDTSALPDFDYIVMNGVLTMKASLTHEAMLQYSRTLLTRLWPKARCGIAFNVTTTYVEWERADLFHLPLDELAGFLTRRISRHFTLRHDYGLYEYTAYVYRSPLDMGAGA
jgi:Methyltransferase domain